MGGVSGHGVLTPYLAVSMCSGMRAERQSATILVRCTPAVRAAFEAGARAEGRSLSNMVLVLALEARATRAKVEASAAVARVEGE